MNKKKPQARKINEHWAAMEAAGLRFNFYRGGYLKKISAACCPLCDHASGGYDRNPCVLVSQDVSSYSNRFMNNWMYARKWTQRDAAMREIIENCPRLQAAIRAAIAAAKEAAAVAKHIRPATATPTASRPANRL